MHNNNGVLGAVVKAARLNKGITQERLAEKIGIGIRHIMAIENEGSHPSYEILYKLIRTLHISADSIFYPEKSSNDYQINEIIRMLYFCDERCIKIIYATVKAMLDSQ